MTRYITNYCVKNDIHTVVMEYKGFKEKKKPGKEKQPEDSESLYARIYMQLEYKFKMKGIRLIRQEESYSVNVRHSQKKYRAFMQRKGIKKKTWHLHCRYRDYNADARSL